MNKAKVVYRPVGMLVGMVGGVLAGWAFGQVWKRLGREGKAPGPLERDRGWGEVLAAAALEGAILAVVRAAVSRGGAEGWQRVTGAWPGD